MTVDASIRRRAYLQHQLLRLQLEQPEPGLVHADDLIHAAEAATGLLVQPLPPDDPLLTGAQALLDRDSEMIWYADGEEYSRERQRFAQVHEFAHFWLHPDLSLDSSLPEDVPPTYSGSALSAAAQIEEGYSPKERREREANVFAAEMVLPGPVVRHAFMVEGLRTLEIAERTGLSETCVLTQLAHALLVSDGRPSANLRPDEVISAPITLDQSQQKAARVDSGPVLVDAGPGTGKTRTLTARIAHLLNDRGVEPENILALTFSNRAAEEMSERLRAAVGPVADRVWMGTFHAFGFEMLRKDGQRIGLPGRPVLLEPADAITLLERNLDLLNLSEYEYLNNPILPFPDILDAISRAKDELKSPQCLRAAAAEMLERASSDDERVEAVRAAEVAHVFGVYEQLLRKSGLVDYGDLIARSVELLANCPDVRERWQRQYRHILADEYQDINRATSRLLQLLAGDGRGFWAVGDLRQAIYRFRGASPANIRQFETDFPGGTKLSLEVNYRSRPSLVRAFGTFAQSMPAAEGVGSEWRPERGEAAQPEITLAAAVDEEAQADWIAENILQRAAAGVPPRDQAVLTATNRQAAVLADMLEARNVAVRHAGPLFDRPEIKDLIALLSLATEPQGIGLIRVSTFPEIGIPPDEAHAVISAAGAAGRAFPAAIEWALDTIDLSAEARGGLERLIRTFKPILFSADPWMLLARYLFSTSAYLQPLLADDTAAGHQRRLAIYQLLMTVQQMGQRLQVGEGEDARIVFLNRMRRLLQLRQSRSVRIPDSGDNIDGVRIMTVHQSKGLEFPVVYLPNLVKGQFPVRGRGRMARLPAGLTDECDDDEGRAEELFFVALSRARDELLLSRTLTWRGRSVEPAPLLLGIEKVIAPDSAPWPVMARRPNPGPAVSDSEAVAASGDPIERAAPQRPDVTLPSLRQYVTCPRQYYYRRVAGLPERGEEGAYRTFYKHLTATLDWLQEQRATAAQPAATEVLAELDRRWPDASEPESGLTRVLRGRARLLVEQAVEHFSSGSKGAPRLELRAELRNGSVRLRADHVEEIENGQVRVTQRLHRKPKKDDHTAEPLALLRLAARQQHSGRSVEVALFSTATGETIEVAESKRWEPRRLERYEAALRELAAGHFPPRPSETICPSCPFFFICPA